MTRCNLWWKPDRTIMWPIIQVQSMSKTILNCYDRLDWVLTMMETKYDNNLTDCTKSIYVENKTKFLWSIRLNLVCDNQTGQRCDRSYIFGLCWNQNWTMRTYLTQCGLWLKLDRTINWPIIQVHSTVKIILNYHDRTDRVLIVIETR